MKKFFVTALQVAVTVFALYWVFRDPEDTRREWPTPCAEAEYWWLFAALFAGAFSPLTATVRLWLLLRVQGWG